MNADFLDAYDRHSQDAQHLFQNERWANADHLFGLSAECGLKAVMVALGMNVDVKGTPVTKKHKVHIDHLWVAFQTFVSGTTSSQYAPLLGSSNPFMDWDVSQRYASQTNFNHALADSHRDGWVQAQMIVKQAQLDGLL